VRRGNRPGPGRQSEQVGKFNWKTGRVRGEARGRAAIRKLRRGRGVEGRGSGEHQAQKQAKERETGKKGDIIGKKKKENLDSGETFIRRREELEEGG